MDHCKYCCPFARTLVCTERVLEKSIVSLGFRMISNPALTSVVL